MRNCASRTTWLNTVVVAVAVLLIALSATACTPAIAEPRTHTVTGGAAPLELAPQPDLADEGGVGPVEAFLVEIAVRLALVVILVLVLLQAVAWLRRTLRWLAGAALLGLVVVLAAYVLVQVG